MSLFVQLSLEQVDYLRCLLDRRREVVRTTLAGKLEGFEVQRAFSAVDDILAELKLAADRVAAREAQRPDSPKTILDKFFAETSKIMIDPHPIQIDLLKNGADGIVSAAERLQSSSEAARVPSAQTAVDLIPESVTRDQAVQMLIGLGAGQPTAEIAQALGLKPKTVWRFARFNGTAVAIVKQACKDNLDIDWPKLTWTGTVSVKELRALVMPPRGDVVAVPVITKGPEGELVRSEVVVDSVSGATVEQERKRGRPRKAAEAWPIETEGGLPDGEVTIVEQPSKAVQAEIVETVAPVDLTKMHWRCACGCGAVAMPLLDETACLAGLDHEEAEWELVNGPGETTSEVPEPNPEEIEEPEPAGVESTVALLEEFEPFEMLAERVASIIVLLGRGQTPEVAATSWVERGVTVEQVRAIEIWARGVISALKIGDIGPTSAARMVRQRAGAEDDVRVDGRPL